MLPVKVEGNAVRIGRRFSVTFQRTLRIPDDGRTYPLPPGLGRLPVCAIADYAARVPPEWRQRRGVFIPLYQREALWLGFDAASWKPNAVQVAVGRINAISGTRWSERLVGRPQNYLVCPDQPWLDGINAGAGMVRQFVAMPLGGGYSVEAQVAGKEEFGGIQIRVYEPKLGHFPDRPPRGRPDRMMGRAMKSMASPAMGLGAGGRMKQKIYPDPYGLDVWDADTFGEVFVHIVNSEQYTALTGRPPPPTPISVQTYTERGFPWFDLFDEHLGDVAASDVLAGIKSVREKDVEHGIVPEGETSLKIRRGQVKKLRLGKGPRTRRLR